MHNFSNFRELQADISRSSFTSDDSSPPLSSTTSLSKLRISVAQIQRSRMKPSSQVLNSAKGLSLGHSSLFKRRAMGESVRENYDSMDSLRITPTVEDKESETGRMGESAHEFRPSNMRHHRRASLRRRNSLVSKERIQELADLNFDDDRKLVQAILRESPEIRHEDEVRFIQKVLEPIKFFTQIKKDLHHKAYKKMFEKLTLEEYGPGIQITDQHTYGKKFYVILEGEVYLMKEKETVAQIVEEEKPTFKRKERARLKRSTRKESLSIENLMDLEEYLKKETNEDKKKVKLETYFANMCLTKTLTQGQSFGEPASLRSKDYPKAISMITKEKTVLGVIDFVDYEEILGQMYQSRIIQRVNMLLNFEMFKHWSHSLLSRLIEQMEEVTLHRHQEIYNQGDYPNYLYFILEGEIELRKTTAPKTSIYDEENCFTTPIEKLKVKPHPTNEKVRLAILSQGNCFGESEFLSKKPRDHGAVVFSQEAQLLYITREKFGWFAVDKETKTSLKALSDSKKTLYENRFTNFVPVNQMLTKLNIEKENVTRSISPQSPKLKFLQPPSTSNPAIITITKKPSQENPTVTRRTNKPPFSFFTYADKKQPPRPQTAANRSAATTFLSSKTHEKQPFSRSQATSPKNFQPDLLLDKSLIRSLAASPKTENALLRSRPTSPTGVIEKRIGSAVMKSRANNENKNHTKSKALTHEREVAGSTIDLDLETENTTVLNFFKPNRQAATQSDLSKTNLESPKAILKNFSFIEPKATKKDAATETKPDDYKKYILTVNDTKITEEPKKKDLRKILKFVSRPAAQNYYALRVQSFSPQNNITFLSPKALNTKSHLPLRITPTSQKIQDTSSLKIEPDSGRVVKYESYLMDKFSTKAHRASRHGGNRLHSGKNRSHNSSPLSWVGGGNTSNLRK